MFDRFLRSCFPFHLTLAADGTVAEVGRSLAKLAPELAKGERFDDHLRVLRPMGVRSLEQIAEDAVVVELVRSGVRFRYQPLWTDEKDRLHLVGSPRSLDSRRAQELGLSARDFAEHDAYPDYLFSLAAKDQLLRETRELSESLSDLNRDLEDRVDERTEQLRDALAAAERASLAKSQFLAKMSHELRTPLHGIAGIGHLLAMDPVAATRSELLSELETCVHGLNDLVSDILDLSKIECEELRLERVPLRLADVAQELVAMFRSAAHAKGIQFEVLREFDPERFLGGDPTRLRQVLVNLVGNAFKFTTEGAIRVLLRETRTVPGGSLVRFEVLDSGPGISEELREQVFESFRQADDSTTRRFGGSGLGLTISRYLVRLMGGQLELESRVGEGSRFWFELRLPREECPGQREVAPVFPTGLSCLIVEDNAVNQRILARVLTMHDNRVEVVENGFEAATLLCAPSHEFDVVLMDVQTPVMDGIEATRVVRRYERAAGLVPVPIVALTADALQEVRERCLEAGMDAFQTKPLRMEELARTLGTVLPVELLRRRGRA